MKTFQLLVLPAMLASALLGGCTSHAASSPSVQPASAIAPAAGPADFAYSEQNILSLQARMQAGDLDSRTLTQAYLDRIAAVDRAGPALNSIIELNADALKDAGARDAERKAGTLRGPLHGIPILLKDNIDATPMVNSAGSLALKDFHPARDAFLAARLRQAGAVILGKTNLSEWANFRSTHSISGWSGRGGQTRNPYVLDRNPCGSSAGSGVAVAANLAVAAIGTETDGSIVCPAAVNGIVGLKPTVGLVSRDGIIPISATQDTAGPMTRDVADAALLLAAIAGPDAADPATRRAGTPAPVDYARHLDPQGLKGARIGVMRSRFAIHPDVAAAMERAIQVMREAGATVVDAEIPTDGQWDKDEGLVLKYEFKDGLERYLSSHGAPVKTLAELIAFNDRARESEMPHFGQELFLEANALRGLDSPDYQKARERARRLAGPEGIDAALEAQQLDALLAPTTGPAWRTDPKHGDDFPGAGYGAAAVAGYPSLSIPMGASRGLPLGLVFMGPAWSEARLIELGYAYEQRARARTPPAFLPTLPQD